MCMYITQGILNFYNNDKFLASQWEKNETIVSSNAVKDLWQCILVFAFTWTDDTKKHYFKLIFLHFDWLEEKQNLKYIVNVL